MVVEIQIHVVILQGTNWGTLVMCSTLSFVIYKAGMIKCLTCKVAGMIKLYYTYEVFSIGSDALKAFSEHCLLSLTENVFIRLYFKSYNTKANLS